MILLAEILGWAGAGALLLAYALLSARRIGAGTGYQLLNLAGSVGLAINGVVHGALPSAALNLTWVAIALLTLRPRPPSPTRTPSPRRLSPRRPTLRADQGLRHVS